MKIKMVSLNYCIRSDSYGVFDFHLYRIAKLQITSFHLLVDEMETFHENRYVKHNENASLLWYYHCNYDQCHMHIMFTSIMKSTLSLWYIEDDYGS